MAVRYLGIMLERIESIAFWCLAAIIVGVPATVLVLMLLSVMPHG
jgi:hypothetical protein